MSPPVHIPPPVNRQPGQSHWHVLGAGAMGCLWASALLQHTQEQGVTLILRDRQVLVDYPGHIELQRPDGSVQQSRLAATSLDDLAESGRDVELLLVSCKAADVVPALRTLQGNLTPSARIVLLQNGLRSHLQSRELLPDARLFAMSVSHGAWLRQPYQAVHAGVGECWLGPLTETAAQDPGIVDRLPQQAMNLHWQAQIMPRLWRKFAINCVINGLTVVYDCPNGRLLEMPVARQHLKLLCNEIATILTALPQAHPIPNLYADVRSVLQITANNISSTLQDVRRQRPTEISEFNGYLCELADAANIACPLNRQLYRQVTAQLSC